MQPKPSLILTKPLMMMVMVMVMVMMMMMMMMMMRATSGPLDHHVLALRPAETREGHGGLNDSSDTLSVFLNFALTTNVWVSQWGACREGIFGDLVSVHSCELC